MGTPPFAATVLRGLLAARHVVRLVGVVTQPDAPAGRHGQVVPPAVKVEALLAGLPVLQPATLRRPAILKALRSLRPELVLVAAYGRILPPAVLRLPGHGCLNVHASLLPKYRGASPVQAAILRGDAETGVTIMLMDEGMDTGPVLARRSEQIRPDDTAGMLTDRLGHIGARLLVEVLPEWLAGRITPAAQDDRDATYCRPLRKSDGLIDWRQSAAVIERQVRAMDPWPGAYTQWRGRLLKVLQAAEAPAATARAEVPPGEVVALNNAAVVATGEGLLLLRRVQLEGRQPLDAVTFLRGQRDFVGSVLGGSLPIEYTTPALGDAAWHIG